MQFSMMAVDGDRLFDACKNFLIIAICIAVFVIFFYFWREIRRAASFISCTYYFTNNKKGN